MVHVDLWLFDDLGHLRERNPIERDDAIKNIVPSFRDVSLIAFCVTKNILHFGWTAVRE
jgi:hypothetical protein